MESLGTKTETLAMMYGKLNTAKVLPQCGEEYNWLNIKTWQTFNKELSCVFLGRYDEMASMEYLGRIGYQRGRIMQGVLIHTLCSKDMKNKKVVLLGAGENSFYAEMLLKERGINVYAYADNSPKLQGTSLRDKIIYSPYELFDDQYYFISTVLENNINKVRLQFAVNKIESYGIFLKMSFHDFLDEDQDLMKIWLEAANKICFENENLETIMPYNCGDNWSYIRLNFMLWSTRWSHWAYLWEKEIIEQKAYHDILEIGPGYGLMSLMLLKQFDNINIDWMLLNAESALIAENSCDFRAGLQKVKKFFPDRIAEIFGSVERDLTINKKYDLVILTEVFEHFALNPVSTMKKLAACLNMGGRIILTTPNWGKLFIYQSWKDMPDGKNVSDEEYKKLLQYGHSYQYDKDELIDIFDQAGLQIEKYNISDENNHNIVLIPKC